MHFPRDVIEENWGKEKVHLINRQIKYSKNNKSVELGNIITNLLIVETKK